MEWFGGHVVEGITYGPKSFVVIKFIHICVRCLRKSVEKSMYSKFTGMNLLSGV